jgi:hypothetical protein
VVKHFRRFLVIAALMFWQGGFTFYAAVVVPIGTEVLGSRLEQGYITRQVANYLNLSGALALLPLAWDLLAGRDPTTWRRRLRWLSWVLMLLCLGILVWLHPRLDALMVEDAPGLLDAQSFRAGHRWYLWISTVQWGCGVFFVWLMVGSWIREDLGIEVENDGEK